MVAEVTQYWCVEANDYNYDEYDRFIVRADTSEAAHMTAILHTVSRHTEYWDHYTQRELRESHQVWRVRPIDDVDGPIVCASYNAG